MSPRQESPHRAFVDGDGKSWRRRGTGPPTRKALLKPLYDPDVVVLHVYLGDEPTLIPPNERKRFWERAEQAMARSAFATFDGEEYVDDQHVHLLLISESC